MLLDCSCRVPTVVVTRASLRSARAPANGGTTARPFEPRRGRQRRGRSRLPPRLFNVTNTKYYLAADISGVAATNPLVDLYAQPGRYIAFNVTARY